MAEVRPGYTWKPTAGGGGSYVADPTPPTQNVYGVGAQATGGGIPSGRSTGGGFGGGLAGGLAGGFGGSPATQGLQSAYPTTNSITQSSVTPERNFGGSITTTSPNTLGQEADIASEARSQAGNIASNAANAAAGYATAAATQQGDLQSKQTQLEAQLAGGARTQAGNIATAAAAQQGDIASGARTQQAGFDTGARTQAGDIAARAAAAGAGYDTAGRAQAGDIAARAASQGNTFAQEQEAQRAKLHGEAWDKRFGAIQGLLNVPGGGAGGGGGAEHITYGDGGNDQMARDAILARAKDTAGQNARAGSDALRGLMSQSGLLGSGYEAAGQAGIVGNAQGAIGDVNREQMIQELARQGHVTDLTYQGNIQQREQDLQQRWQDLQRQQALIALAGGIQY